MNGWAKNFPETNGHIYFTIEEAKPEKLARKFQLRSKKGHKVHRSLNQSPQKNINE